VEIVFIDADILWGLFTSFWPKITYQSIL